MPIKQVNRRQSCQMMMATGPILHDLNPLAEKDGYCVGSCGLFRIEGSGPSRLDRVKNLLKLGLGLLILKTICSRTSANVCSKSQKAMKQSHASSINLGTTLRSVLDMHSHARSRGQHTVLSKARRLCCCCYWTWPMPVNMVTFLVTDCRPFPINSISAYLP